MNGILDPRDGSQVMQYVVEIVVVGDGTPNRSKLVSFSPAPTTAASAATTVVAPVAASPSTGDAIRVYLQQNFGLSGYETSWFGSIKGVQVNGGKVTVSTDLPPGAEGKRLAGLICSGVSGFVYDRGNSRYGLGAVEVLAQSGQLLILRADAGGRCQ